VKAPAVAGSIKAGNAVKAPAETLDGKAYESRKKAGRIAWGIALLVLCAALVLFNFLDPAVRAETGTGVSEQAATGAEGSGQAGTGVDATGQAGATIGFEPGMELADFTMECLDGSEFHLADTRGKVVFINLWATYCTPCVQELPHFDELYRQHEGDIAMLAVHSTLVTDDPAEFLADKGWTIPFAVDTEDDMLWSIVDGSSTLPQTIVLDRNGIVIYNQKGSVTPEVLAALYEQAAGE
jgi:thiol-disulfide isomerase/thioredoxin